MSKQPVKVITSGTKLRGDLLDGVNIISNVVKTSLGPKGRTTLIDQGELMNPIITKDGVSIANAIKLTGNKNKDLAIKVLKQAANLTNEQAGDGTTTTTVLSQALFNEGVKYITAGADPMSIKRGMEIAKTQVVELLGEISNEVTNVEQIEQVATISANGDELVGKLVAKAMDAVGESGIVTVENSNSTKDEVDIIKGLQIDRGLLSPYFINNQEKQITEMINPYILLVDDVVTHINEVMPVLELVAQNSGHLLIIAEDYDDEALSTLIVNKTRGAINVCAIKAPGFGEIKTLMLEDIAISTNAVLVSRRTGYKIDDLNIDMLGRCERVIVDNNSTIIIEGAGDKAHIDSRIAEIKKGIEEAGDNKQREKRYQERLAKITGGVAVLKVFAHSEIELKEKKDRIDDALGSTRAAIEEGIVIGGGCALAKIKGNLNTEILGDEGLGYKIVKNSLTEMLKCIADNSGQVGEIIVGKINDLNNLGNDSVNTGYDAINNEFVDMFKTGIIDPTKVERVAVENAVSVVSTLLTTENVITDGIMEV